MTEAQLKADIRIALGQVGHARLFNNPVGEAWLGKVIARDAATVTLVRPMRVTYGLMVGSGDVVGWTSVTITPGMVGCLAAIFTSGEIKTPDAPPPRENQDHWRRTVREAGGFSAIVRSVDDALRLVRA